MSPLTGLPTPHLRWSEHYPKSLRDSCGNGSAAALGERMVFVMAFVSLQRPDLEDDHLVSRMVALSSSHRLVEMVLDHMMVLFRSH